MTPRIIVHGGAHDLVQDQAQRQKAVEDACKAAYEVLLEKGALDAAETAIHRMESCPFLNAGRGSYLQLDGVVRMDAAIMTEDLSAGSVINIEDVEHPISVARRVMETTGHVMLAGRAATEFARSEGFPRYDPRTRNQVHLWLEIMDQIRARSGDEGIFRVGRSMESQKRQYGTVGCVCIDSEGTMAAGTSSGGRKMNVPGRVGDSGIIGAGTYCAAEGGVSCTGVGEKILLLSLAKEVVNYLRSNKVNASDAAEHGMKQLDGMNARGGLICMDKAGNIGHAYNTKFMTLYSMGESQ